MSEAAIDRLLPLPAASALSDDDIARLYDGGDRDGRWVRVNFISSVDGAATHDGLSGGLGMPADKRVFDLLRRLCDVVVVGAGTVRTEGYGAMRVDEVAEAWRTANGLAPQPVFVIVSGRLAIDPASEIFTKAPVTPILVTTSEGAAVRGDLFDGLADVLIAGDSEVDTRIMLDALESRGHRRIHCEGGPHLFGDLLREGTVDELCLTLSPRWEGPDGRRIVDGNPIDGPVGLTLAHVLHSGDALLLRYTR